MPLLPSRQGFFRAIPHRWVGAGFTLIELLVSCAVLAALVVLLASTFSNFVGLTTASSKRLETSNQNRTVFDRMAFDLGSSIRTGGVEINFKKNGQVLSTNGVGLRNDSFSLLVDARSTTTNSRLARIGYEVGTDNNVAANIATTSLQRCVQPFYWGDNILNRDLEASLAEVQTLGKGVFRLELSFLMTDGSIQAQLAGTNKASDVAAVICSTASLDEQTFGQLQGDQRKILVNLLPDAVNGELPLSKWSATNFADDSLPRTIMQNVRFNQRQFYLQ